MMIFPHILLLQLEQEQSNDDDNDNNDIPPHSLSQARKNKTTQ